MADFEVRYIGPSGEGVEESGQVVPPGGKIKLPEERAAHLLEDADGWELVGKGAKPKGAPTSEVVAYSLTPSPTDVHENPPAEADAPAQADDGEK